MKQSPFPKEQSILFPSMLRLKKRYWHKEASLNTCACAVLLFVAPVYMAAYVRIDFQKASISSL